MITCKNCINYCQITRVRWPFSLFGDGCVLDPPRNRFMPNRKFWQGCSSYKTPQQDTWDTKDYEQRLEARRLLVDIHERLHMYHLKDVHFTFQDLDDRIDKYLGEHTL